MEKFQESRQEHGMQIPVEKSFFDGYLDPAVNGQERGMTNKEEIYDLIQKHPEGLDDDDISKLTGIEPRQQVQQLCTQLASVKRIRRESVDKAGKRRKIHNFPSEESMKPGNGPQTNPTPSPNRAQPNSENWRRRLLALVAATGRDEADLLEEALQLMGIKVLGETHRKVNDKTATRKRKK